MTEFDLKLAQNAKIIFVCSKLRGNLERNRKIAEHLCRVVSLLGHIPIAPHVYFTRFLDDFDDEERLLGIESGVRLLEKCDEVWVFDFEGISDGMRMEIKCAKKLNKPVRSFSKLIIEEKI